MEVAVTMAHRENRYRREAFPFGASLVFALIAMMVWQLAGGKSTSSAVFSPLLAWGITPLPTVNSLPLTKQKPLPQSSLSPPIQPEKSVLPVAAPTLTLQLLPSSGQFTPDPAAQVEVLPRTVRIQPALNWQPDAEHALSSPITVEINLPQSTLSTSSIQHEEGVGHE